MNPLPSSQLLEGWQDAMWSPWGRVLRTLKRSAKYETEAAIEATAEHFRAHGVATQVIMSLEGVRKVSSARLFVPSAYSRQKSHRAPPPPTA